MLETAIIEVDSRPVRLHHRPGSPTVLLLHGYPDTLQVFSRLVPALPAAWGVVAPDFPGQGRSAASNVVSPEARGRWLGELLDSVGVESPYIVAHDMGAHAALELGLLGRAKGLVVSHALLEASQPTSWSIRLLRASRLYRVALPLVPQLVVSRCLATFLEPGSVSVALEHELRETFPSAARVTVAVCDEAEAWLARGLARFARLSVPLSLLWTKRAPHFSIDHGRALERVVPRAELRELERGGHWLAWSHPHVVVEALLDLSRQAQST